MLILGGVPLAEIQEGGRLWLRLKNRPLDAEYQPHRSVSLGSPEDGYYWAVFSPQDVPHTARCLVRVTIVGRVMVRPLSVPDGFSADPGPVLAGMYLRAWSVGDAPAETWEEHRDPHYLDPRGYGEPSQRHCWTCGSPYGGE